MVEANIRAWVIEGINHQRSKEMTVDEENTIINEMIDIIEDGGVLIHDNRSDKSVFLIHPSARINNEKWSAQEAAIYIPLDWLAIHGVPFYADIIECSTEIECKHGWIYAPSTVSHWALDMIERFRARLNREDLNE